jgi:hypothetical protein
MKPNFKLTDWLGEFGRMILEKPASRIVQFFRSTQNDALKLVLADGRELIVEANGNAVILVPWSLWGKTRQTGLR